MNLQFQKVINGLAKCLTLDEPEQFLIDDCDNCPYKADFPDCNIKLRDDAIRLIIDYDVALRMMVYQYCTIIQNEKEVFFHNDIPADEIAFKVLGIKNGDEVKEDFIWS